MTVPELYELLNSKKFMNPEDGDLFYNFFIYQYDPEKEYDMVRQIREFKENLRRPDTYVDALTLDLFEVFCEFLDQTPFMDDPSLLHFLLEAEGEDPEVSEQVSDTLRLNAHSREFMEFLAGKIKAHIEEPDDVMKRPYVFLYGVGAMAPYLRVNELLAMYEDFNITDKYKLLVFYPGNRIENSFSLFGCLPDHHTYRATLLINE